MKTLLHLQDLVKSFDHQIVLNHVSFELQTGEIIGCPIFNYNIESPLHIEIETENRKGYVQCENLSMLDLNMRGFAVIDRIAINDVMDITDTIQGIFDYI